MPNYSEMLPHRFFKAEDLASGPVTLTIKDIRMENVAPEDQPKEMKPIVFFNETARGAALNKERAEVLTELFGPDSTAAIGHQIKLLQGRTRFKGKLVPCVTFEAATSQTA